MRMYRYAVTPKTTCRFPSRRLSCESSPWSSETTHPVRWVHLCLYRGSLTVNCRSTLKNLRTIATVKVTIAANDGLGRTCDWIPTNENMLHSVLAVRIMIDIAAAVRQVGKDRRARRRSIHNNISKPFYAFDVVKESATRKLKRLIHCASRRTEQFTTNTCTGNHGGDN